MHASESYMRNFYDAHGARPQVIKQMFNIAHVIDLLPS
jgi:hypothetical protein